MNDSIVEIMGFPEGAGFEFVIIYYLFYFLALMAFSIGSYILQSISLHSIARRRGIQKPWLAWVPLGEAWIMGSVSDQYRYVVKGQIKNKRKVLLTLEIFTLLLAFLFMAFAGAYMVNGIMYPDVAWNSMGLFIVVFVFVYVGICGLAIATAVVRYMALFDLYRSCRPSASVPFLLVSIFVAAAMPVFILLCRNKDDGMPPRKPELIQE